MSLAMSIQQNVTEFEQCVIPLAINPLVLIVSQASSLSMRLSYMPRSVCPLYAHASIMTYQNAT